MTELEQLGQRLRKWRMDQEPTVSQGAVGEAVGVGDAAVRHFEAGRYNLSIRTKLALCEFTGLPFRALATKGQVELATRAGKAVGE